MTSAGKSVAVVQSCYIPWKGYFDLINSVDEFILYDDQQYTKRDWRNRNRVKTPQGTIWLSIPVNVKGRYFQRIDETAVSDPGWTARHWQTLTHAYRSAPHFSTYRELFEQRYLECNELLLSKVNRMFIETICDVLGIRTKLSWSTDYAAEGVRTERLVSLCRSAGADAYLSGPAARDYLDETLFAEAGIQLRYADYEGYPAYEQVHPPFEHTVTVLDLLFHTGPAASKYMRSFSANGRTTIARDAA